MGAPSRLALAATCVPRLSPVPRRPAPSAAFADARRRGLPLQVKRVFCESSGALVPKDKAVKRFIVRNIVESAAIRDLQESCVFDGARLATAAAADTGWSQGARACATRAGAACGAGGGL